MAHPGEERNGLNHTCNDSYIFTEVYQPNIMTKVVPQIDVIAQRLGMPQHELVRQGVRHYLESQQRELQAELNLLKAKYKVDTVEQFEDLYRQGTIEEASTWRDYQQFDTLSFKLAELIDMQTVAN